MKQNALLSLAPLGKRPPHAGKRPLPSRAPLGPAWLRLYSALVLVLALVLLTDSVQWLTFQLGPPETFAKGDKGGGNGGGNGNGGDGKGADGKGDGG